MSTDKQPIAGCDCPKYCPRCTGHKMDQIKAMLDESQATLDYLNAVAALRATLDGDLTLATLKLSKLSAEYLERIQTLSGDISKICTKETQRREQEDIGETVEELAA